MLTLHKNTDIHLPSKRVKGGDKGAPAGGRRYRAETRLTEMMAKMMMMMMTNLPSVVHRGTAQKGRRKGSGDQL